MSAAVRSTTAACPVAPTYRKTTDPMTSGGRTRAPSTSQELHMIAASRTVLFAAVLGGISLLAACGANPAPGSAPSGKKQETTVISSAIQEAIGEAQKEISEGNITVSKDEHNGGKKAE